MSAARNARQIPELRSPNCRICDAPRGQLVPVQQLAVVNGTPRLVWDILCGACAPWARMVLR